MTPKAITPSTRRLLTWTGSENWQICVQGYETCSSSTALGAASAPGLCPCSWNSSWWSMARGPNSNCQSSRFPQPWWDPTIPSWSATWLWIILTVPSSSLMKPSMTYVNATWISYIPISIIWLGRLCPPSPPLCNVNDRIPNQPGPKPPHPLFPGHVPPGISAKKAYAEQLSEVKTNACFKPASQMAK